MTNCVAAKVRDAAGTLMFDGHQRGIAGSAILDASVAQVALFADLIERQNLPTRIIGVGGASSAIDVQRYLDAGAECVHIATAAMIDPLVGRRIKDDLVQSRT